MSEKLEPEPNGRNRTTENLSEAPVLTYAGTKISEDTDWNQQQAATARQGIMELPACCKQILKG